MIARWARLPEAVRVLVGSLAALAAIIATAQLLGLATPGFVIALGALLGVSYGLLAMCLTLTFRISGVVNFALPAMGILAVAFLNVLVGGIGLPYWIGVGGVLVIGFGVGAGADVLVVRRFANAPRVVGMTATLGLAAVLISTVPQVLSFSSSGIGSMPASPPGLFTFNIGPLLVTEGYTGLIIGSPVLVAALVLFLSRSRYGLAVRASASNPDAARLAGVSPVVMSALAWGAAGTIGTFVTVMIETSSDAAPTFDPATLLPALAAAALARLSTLPRAFAAGIIVGVIEQIVLWDSELARYRDAVLLAILLLVLMFGTRIMVRREHRGSWLGVSGLRPLPRRLVALWPVRHLALIVGVLGGGVMLLLALRDDNSANMWTGVLGAGLVAMSVSLVAGLAGELPLGQYAIAAVGAVASYRVVSDTGNFALGLGAAALTGGITATLLAYPGLRARGFTMTVVSFAFAVAVPTALLANPRVFGPSGVEPGLPIIGGDPLRPGIGYFLFAVAVCTPCALIAWNTWRGGFSRVVRAARDNPDAAQSFGIGVLGAQLRLFMLSGALAGVAGALIGHSYTNLSANAFPAMTSVLVVFAAVVGGLGALSGAALGTMWLFLLPAVEQASSGAGDTSAATMATYTAALAILLAAPGGATALLRFARDFLAIGIGRLCGVRCTMAELRGERAETEGNKTERIEAEGIDEAGSPSAQRPVKSVGARTLPMLREVTYPAAPPGTPLLECRGLALSYGPNAVIRNLDFTVSAGEILGLIGPNGAGKTSTFEMISGFVRPDAGSVLLDGTDITRLPPARRVSRGLVRSFQDAALFPTLTTVDTIEVALERQRRTRPMASILGVDRTARHRRRVAEEVIDYFGLTPFRESRVAELSTGTRRILELACLLSLRPRLLLLDEPSSGVAQREIEALGGLLASVRRDFDLAMVVIEHDIPLVMSLSDRVVAMAEGTTLCVGTPAEVRADSRVVDAYLGGSTVALQRSDIPVAEATQSAEPIK
ncbi:ABC transporter permease subunit [Streptomyces mirabilis]|uniref:ABC transporter permease subunit n=1 Tax=Streptomyces mirabilis TaxID=68239 RepID=UPI0033204C89